MDSAEPKQSVWSVRVATVVGVPIRIHVTFLLVLLWAGYFSAQSGSDLDWTIALLLLLFLCVVLHELGHALMARVFGVRTREIVLYPIGGVARLENVPEGVPELFIALAGPAVNLALAALLLVSVVLLGAPLDSLEQITGPTDVLVWLMAMNVALFLFNLLPAFPMDGGRVLRAGLSLFLPTDRATDIAATVGQGFAFLFGLWGIFNGNPGLVIIALFVYIGAAQEALFHRQRAVVQGRTAREAMITSFETLAPQSSLGEATERLLATHQQDFPVVDAWGRVVGVLPRAGLLEGLARHGRSAPVLEIMDRDVEAVRPDDLLERVLECLRRKPGSPVVVIDDGKLVGMITLENLTEFIEVSRRARVAAPV